MWPFSKRYSYSNSGVLRGATDWHCHILPGVDDGIQKMEDTLRLLHLYQQTGIAHVWFTPHIMEDTPNTLPDLRARFAEVQEAWTAELAQAEQEQTEASSLQLHLAAENMLDNLFEERLAAGELLPLGAEGDHLLVETSYYNPPYDLWGTLENIQRAGYHPVLAHPERYHYMNEKDYERLHQMGVRLQLNLPSLVGGYGPESKARAQRLLSLDYYSFKGSDTHRVKQFEITVNERALKESCLKQLAKLQ